MLNLNLHIYLIRNPVTNSQIKLKQICSIAQFKQIDTKKQTSFNRNILDSLQLIKLLHHYFVFISRQSLGDKSTLNTDMFKSHGQIEIKINRKLNIYFTIKLFNIQYSIK
ncbi:hypothetical protein BpHYR1_017102 [Brachionus plicatilis]|uniref:Uncharacterized protein n=1 Tax=Brachionus plicatilis TaxID=10195 RepID=A0A3M7RTQ2_BRAPC|nr:hypothetical protein BpHYR1_017102 [Brachionus plicatilis]